MSNIKANWVKLRPGLVCSQLSDGQVRVETEAGKFYSFGHGYQALLALLYQGTSLPDLQSYTAHKPELTGSMLMLEELQLLEYSRERSNVRPILGTPSATASAPAGSRIIPARLRSASLLLSLLCGWQLFMLVAFAYGSGIAELPRISLLALLQSTLPAYALLGLLVWVAGHEIAHASAARWCGVQGGKIQWASLVRPNLAFQAPPQDTLNRADVRFFIFSAGPLFDLLCALGLALAWHLAPVAQAAPLKALFILSLLIGLPNSSMLSHADMGQGMQAFRALCQSPLPSTLYCGLSVAYASVVLLLAVKLMLLVRFGTV